MNAFDLIVRGGVVVNHAGAQEADIGAAGGKIAAMATSRVFPPIS
jgi:dihydroorotase